MKISEQIQQAIVNDRRTQTQIAREAGLTVSMVSYVVSGQKGLSRESLDRLGAILGLELIQHSAPKSRRYVVQ